ncbi:hypothetical protein DEO72_LG7g1432 [Vigna unguiculata]|uniref:Uncharacterized protein n=1 Tax=Vigna unguiculata TaxID=3917 RepID=A0A4D6MFK3_VIGUN|nr:hypothetical protein DEO72_LG7g1432 [Vigna unguiculata]
MEIQWLPGARFDSNLVWVNGIARWFVLGVSASWCRVLLQVGERSGGFVVLLRGTVALLVRADHDGIVVQERLLPWLMVAGRRLCQWVVHAHGLLRCGGDAGLFHEA